MPSPPSKPVAPIEGPQQPENPASLGPHLRKILIRAVIAVFAWEVFLVTAGIVVCEQRSPNNCAERWAQGEGAAKGIPATLLAWIAESPLR